MEKKNPQLVSLEAEPSDTIVSKAKIQGKDRISPDQTSTS